ncbi:oligopeptide transport system permease protein [Bacillus sp. OV322]|uniref:ABC transporter permease subunit n=1 Tax=Bacillus sp. OV322 TaxID=1882764 RepID=UPI0008EED9C1|nr:ABC transporter permease subunit [Bacillus sp. OV322]SFC27177.1 oligopeptide transport system permease protein [Bacillus sp. OV322]
MRLLLKLFGSLLMWGIVACLLILITLLPRDIESHRVGYDDIMEYHFSWEAYENNIKDYLKDVKIHKSLGITAYEMPVETEMLHYGWRSAKVIIPALIISLIAGIFKGIYDYNHQSGFSRIFGKNATWLGQSVPEFISIMFIQTVLFEAGKYGFPDVDIYGDEHWYNIFLPILFVSMYPAAIIARYTSEAIENEDGRDYILTARSKGIGDRIVLWRHTLRNCWPNLLQQSIPVMMILLSGMFIVEFMSQYRGIGLRLVSALHIKSSFMAGAPMPIDTSAVIGFSLLFTLILLITQWLTQIVSHFVNPVKRRAR